MIKPRKIALVKDDKLQEEMRLIWDKLESVPAEVKIRLNDLLVNMTIYSFNRGMGAGVRIVKQYNKKKQERLDYKKRSKQLHLLRSVN